LDDFFSHDLELERLIFLSHDWWTGKMVKFVWAWQSFVEEA
jgi:hypothetical protein